MPGGRWTHLLDGEVREGGGWHCDELDFFQIPLWLRPNGLVCVGTSEREVEYEWSRRIRLICGWLEGKGSREVRVPDARGGDAGRLELYHDGERVRANSSVLADFELQLPWAQELLELERGSVVRGDPRAPLTTAGILIRADSGALSFRYRA